MDWQTRLVENFPLARVKALNLALPLLFSAVAAAVAGREAAAAVLVGGALINLSFLALTRDLRGAFYGPPKLEKLRFLIKFYMRLGALAAVLFYLVRVQHINIFGLLAGLSTVAISILIVTAAVAGKLYFTEREAL